MDEQWLVIDCGCLAPDVAAAEKSNFRCSNKTDWHATGFTTVITVHLKRYLRPILINKGLK